MQNLASIQPLSGLPPPPPLTSPFKFARSPRTDPIRSCKVCPLSAYRYYYYHRSPRCVHAVGPAYYEELADGKSYEDCDALVRSAYTASMQRAQEKGAKSIGFALLSAGIFRGDQTLEKVLEMGVDGVLAGAYEGLEEVHLCAFKKQEQQALLGVCKRMLEVLWVREEDEEDDQEQQQHQQH